MTEKTYEPAATRKAQIMEIIERFEWGRQEVPFSEVDVWADSNYPISEIDQWICAGVCEKFRGSEAGGSWTCSRRCGSKWVLGQW